MPIRYKLAILTPIFIILSHYLAVFPHEYGHSFMAWILGYKSNPLNITYGGMGWKNIILLSNIDENVDYKVIYNSNYRAYMSLVAFAGPGIANGFLYFLSSILLNKRKIKSSTYLYYFLFWFNLMNIGNFYDYVPIRAFSIHDDMANFERGLNISPWLVYIIFGYIVGFIIWHFFTKSLINAFIILKFDALSFQIWLMVVCVVILFGYFGEGITALRFPVQYTQYYGQISYFLAITSLISIPIIIFVLWPTRKWVINQLNFLSINHNKNNL